MTLQTRQVATREHVHWRWLVALLPLIVIMHEGHELAHTVAGRAVCGHWAVRTFNTWSIDQCTSWVPCATGPLFSYLVMGVGVWLARGTERGRRWLALALIFAANPLARLITVGSGRGDELIVARMLAGTAHNSPMQYAVTFAVALLLAGTAITVGWFATRGLRARLATFVLLLFCAILVTGPGTHALNRLLAEGMLTRVVAGAPMLVHVVTLAAVVGFLATTRWLVDPAKAANPGTSPSAGQAVA